MSYDLVVVGLGAMGSATLDCAARRGLRVLGVEQFAPGHALGSSHGKSRLIRKAYFEDAAYVPLVLRAYELWDDLERRSGRTLLRRTGVLQVGLEQSAVVRGVQRSASLHGLALDVLDAGEMRRNARCKCGSNPQRTPSTPRAAPCFSSSAPLPRRYTVFRISATA